MKSAPDVKGATQTVFNDAKRGAEMTGTLQFMAAELLGAIVHKNRKVKHEAHHDLESFVWVLMYVISRTSNERKGLLTEQHTWIKEHFVESFGHQSVKFIHISRRSCEPLAEDVYGDLLPQPMVALLVRLKKAVHAHFAPPPSQWVEE